MDVEQTRGIANVRIHVERVIGLLRRKHAILQSTLPTDYLTCNRNGPPEIQVPIIDRIIKVCSALVNFCFAIVVDAVRSIFWQRLGQSCLSLRDWHELETFKN